MISVTGIVYQCESLPNSPRFTQFYDIHCEVTTENKLMAIAPEHMKQLLKSSIEKHSQQLFDLLIALRLLLNDPHNDEILALLTKCVNSCVPEDIDFSKYAEHLDTKLRGLYVQD